MNLLDRFHCPDCKGPLSAPSRSELRCQACGRVTPLRDGVADFVSDHVPGPTDPDRYGVRPDGDEAMWSGLLKRIRAATGDRWPQHLGQVIELGCGRGQFTAALIGSVPVRGLVAIDTDADLVVNCRDNLATQGLSPEQPAVFATMTGHRNALRDAIADTVAGMTLLSASGDVGDLLSAVYRIMKPGGRAMFVVPNRRYRQALCHALAEGLSQHYGRDQSWPDGHYRILGAMAQTRRLLIHRGDQGYLAGLAEKHLFDSEWLEDLALEVGFATAEMLPLDPDPHGSESVRHVCRIAGMPDEDIKAFVPLVATAGQPFFSLLSRQDSAASMVLWLTKAHGPRVAVFHAPPLAQPIPFDGPRPALGGIQPRWSLELLARDTPDGIELSLGGWCLANTDVVWVRVTLEAVTLHASVWRPRPDVHEVLNQAGHYHPLNAMCSGIETEMLFGGVHAVDDRCSLRFDILLANGLTVSGPAPDDLVMGEQLVIAY